MSVRHSQPELGKLVKRALHFLGNKHILTPDDYEASSENVHDLRHVDLDGLTQQSCDKQIFHTQDHKPVQWQFIHYNDGSYVLWFTCIHDNGRLNHDNAFWFRRDGEDVKSGHSVGYSPDYNKWGHDYFGQVREIELHAENPA